MSSEQRTKEKSDSSNKKIRKVSAGKVVISVTLNNVIVSVSDSKGDVLGWESAGKYFKGSRKATTHAAQFTASKAAQLALDHGMHSVDIIMRGPGPVREAAVKAFGLVGLNIGALVFDSSLPHGGCRAKKRRRN